jgi:hypothetical protein
MNAHFEILETIKTLVVVDKTTEPCGGCGETDPNKRCMGCMHDFGEKDSWVHQYRSKV